MRGEEAFEERRFAGAGGAGDHDWSLFFGRCGGMARLAGWRLKEGGGGGGGIKG